MHFKTFKAQIAFFTCFSCRVLMSAESQHIQQLWFLHQTSHEGKTTINPRYQVCCFPLQPSSLQTSQHHPTPAHQEMSDGVQVQARAQAPQQLFQPRRCT